MKILTHVTISMVLYGHFKKKMKLNRLSFIYGNIKPDLSYKQIKTAHIMENHFGNVCESVNELMQNTMDRQKFSTELGQICHYVSDFFCRYHLDREIFHKLGGHFLYEIRLQFLMWKLLSRNQLDYMPKKERKERRNIASILLEMRSNYISETAALEKDLVYALSTALWIGESVGYYLAEAAEPVRESEIAMDYYAMLPMTGGK
ncbi:MAG: zinc dependent phospholipase C family protein [Desulfitobacterium sp.]